MKVKLDSQDKSYVSRVKSCVENHNRQTFDVTDLNGQTVMLGSEGIVALALAMRETMTVINHQLSDFYLLDILVKFVKVKNMRL